MINPQEQLDAIKDMRMMMERSSRFISLSGLSGLAIGIMALMGASGVYLYLDLSPFGAGFKDSITQQTLPFMIIDGLIVLIASLTAGIWMSFERSRKMNLPVWDLSAKRLLINLMIPLVAGGLFCIMLIKQDLLFLLPSVTLIFYGLALVNASKYTLDEIRNLGVLEVILGLIGAWKPDWGLLCWSLGFGILHIGYGLLIHNKQENQVQ